MYFDNFTALLHMDGHGFYVWLAYAVALCVILGLLLIPGMQKRRFVRAYRQTIKRQQQAAPVKHELETTS